MSEKNNIREMGDILSVITPGKPSPLCIYGSEETPKNSRRSNEIHFCITNAIISLSLQTDIDAIYLGTDVKKKTCPGSRAWLGYEPFNPFLKYFVSTGIKKFPAEYLSKDPEISEKKLRSLGKLTAVGKYTVIRRCITVDPEEEIPIRAYLCFGTAEEIRNLSMLIYFDSESCFNNIQVPWGSSCGSFITYPAAVAENVPKGCTFIGPLDPTDNYYFPPDILSMGIPVDMMKKLQKNVKESFVVKRPNVAYPKERVDASKLFSEEELKKFSHNLFSHR